MNDRSRERFDAMLDQAVQELPEWLDKLIEEAPIVVDDRPSPEMLKKLGMPAGVILSGLYTGISLDRRSVEVSGYPTDVIRLFRDGIVQAAGGWRGGGGRGADDAVYEQIRITLLHEIGHHFGLDEDDLEELGYG